MLPNCNRQDPICSFLTQMLGSCFVWDTRLAMLTLPSRCSSDVTPLNLQPCWPQLAHWEEGVIVFSVQTGCQPALTCLQVWQDSFTVRSDVRCISTHVLHSDSRSDIRRKSLLAGNFCFVDIISVMLTRRMCSLVLEIYHWLNWW